MKQPPAEDVYVALLFRYYIINLRKMTEEDVHKMAKITLQICRIWFDFNEVEFTKEMKEDIMDTVVKFNEALYLPKTRSEEARQLLVAGYEIKDIVRLTGASREQLRGKRAKIPLKPIYDSKIFRNHRLKTVRKILAAVDFVKKTGVYYDSRRETKLMDDFPRFR